MRRRNFLRRATAVWPITAIRPIAVAVAATTILLYSQPLSKSKTFYLPSLNNQTWEVTNPKLIRCIRSTERWTPERERCSRAALSGSGGSSSTANSHKRAPKKTSTASQSSKKGEPDHPSAKPTKANRACAPSPRGTCCTRPVGTCTCWYGSGQCTQANPCVCAVQ